MPEIDYASFTRLILRSREVAEEPKMNASVVVVYNATLKDHAQTYLTAAAAVTAAESSFGKENKEALAALAVLDGPYRETRSAVAAILPETKLPDTLKSQPTDTDKLKAIQDLLNALDDHAGEAWADTLLQADFATKAPGTLKEINEAIAANKVLSKALEDRATHYGPTYERYLRFKRVVRDALGPKSKQYKRIHLRSASASAGAEEGEEPKADPKDAKGTDKTEGPAAAKPPAAGVTGATGATGTQPAAGTTGATGTQPAAGATGTSSTPATPAGPTGPATPTPAAPTEPAAPMGGSTPS